jgi:hypothetical protein
MVPELLRDIHDLVPQHIAHLENRRATLVRTPARDEWALDAAG